MAGQSKAEVFRHQCGLSHRQVPRPMEASVLSILKVEMGLYKNFLLVGSPSKARTFRIQIRKHMHTHTHIDRHLCMIYTGPGFVLETFHSTFRIQRPKLWQVGIYGGDAAAELSCQRNSAALHRYRCGQGSQHSLLR